MKIEDIEKACKLNKEQKEIEEILELKNFVDTTLSSPILVLFHDNERHNITPYLHEKQKFKYWTSSLVIVRKGRNKSNKKLKNYKKQYMEKLDRKKNPQVIN